MTSARTAVFIGVGPGLGMSMAQRFGREGFRVALVSRTDTRHTSYLADLAAKDIEGTAYTADIADTDRLSAVLKEIAESGEIEFVYYGSPGTSPQHIVPITDIDVATAKSAFSPVWAAVHLVSTVLPAMMERSSGGVIFAGGMSSVRPVPMMGQLNMTAAALRNYALTLNGALADRGVYAGTLTIGRVVERGDIHTMISAHPEKFGNLETVDPDEIAEAAWDMYNSRDRAEHVFDASRH
jgi:short-subunit dehydrogenase